MQEYERDSRLCLLHDSETGDELWLRRHGLQLHTRKQLAYILATEERGAQQPMTPEEIETFFLGEEYECFEVFGTCYYQSHGSAPQGSGFCYHPTKDIAYTFYKEEPEAPAVGHVLYAESPDALTIRSIAVDAECRFRPLLYRVLLDELKHLVVKAGGYQSIESISAPLRGEGERRFYEHNHFRTVQMPEGIQMAHWLPEFEGKRKRNRTAK